MKERRRWRWGRQFTWERLAGDRGKTTETGAWSALFRMSAPEVEKSQLAPLLFVDPPCFIYLFFLKTYFSTVGSRT